MATPSEGLHAGVLDALGREIVSGEAPVGSVLRIDQLDERFGVSRSVVREAVRVLASMGLVETRRRLGLRVQPRSAWNVFDPRVIGWRLDGPEREDQLLSLGELRRAVEPMAAALAAERATPDQCGLLVGAVVQMTVQARAGDAEAFLAADSLFHRTLLEASGNEMLAALTGVVHEVLAGRTPPELGLTRAVSAAIRLHAEVAQAIGSGDAEAASAAMRAIVDAG